MAQRRLRIGLNYGNVVDLPDFSIGPHGTPEELHQAVADAQYEGLQGGDVELGRRSGLVLLGSGLLNQPSDAGTLAACFKEKGASVVTCIAGYGMESDQEMDAYAGAICEASADHKIPLLLETHRASITQDAWRTVQLTQRFPELRFNLDLSHWFTGQEMLYGDLDSRVNFLEPVLARTEFIHGRVGNRCCLQVPLEEAEKALPVFRRIWTRVMEAYLSREPDDDRSPQADLWFCPELLGPAYDYARLFREGGGEVREETDRWQQAAALVAIACECFQDALRFNVNGTRLTSENKMRTTRERVCRP